MNYDKENRVTAKAVGVAIGETHDGQYWWSHTDNGRFDIRAMGEGE